MSDDLSLWLRQLGLAQYETVFAEQQIDREVLPQLTDADLKELGIPLGPRKKLLKAIAALQSDSNESRLSDVATNRPASLLPESTEAERRQLTVMFCDLAGSTELSQRLDPEDLRELNLAYQDACKAAIERYEGYVARYMGDGVLTYFGYPKAHEDDAERAVHAGLAVVEAVGEIGQTTDRETRIELGVRAGIATGLVVVGDLIGDGASQESAVVGETPNLAARLQALASPNTVVISRATHDLAAGRFEYADLGTHELKGIAGPVQAWRVIGRSATESRFEALHRTGLTPLVGREHEIGLLLERWEQSKEGDGQVVLLSGEAGIGKSRIIQTLRERSAADKPVRLRHQCSPYYANSALHPVIEQLERAARFDAGDPPEARLKKLERMLAQSTRDIESVAPLFAALLSIPAEGRYALLEMTPERRKERTLEALVAQIEGLTQERPVLFVFEDAHWADPTSLELLELVVERAQGIRILALITFRPEFHPPWTAHTHITSLTLNRFSRSLVAAMVDKVTGGKPLPAEVREQIVEKTDGVPLFVEELTKTVLESKLVEEVNGAYVLAKPLPPLAIPSTLHDSLMARLDRLGAVKEVAQCAAAIGREFSFDLLSAASALPSDKLRNALDQLLDAGLVFRHGRSLQARFFFKHALVQNAAYDSVLRSKRRQLHGRIAEALRTRFPEVTTLQPELLAHHYSEAGQTGDAIEYWLQAGRRATERSADKEAIGHLTKGLEALRTLPESTERLRKELTFRVALCSPLMVTKGFTSEETAEMYARAHELCELLGETEQFYPVLFGEWVHHHVGAEYGLARQVATQLLRLSEQQNDIAAMAVGHRLLSWTALMLGGLSVVPPHLDKALALYSPQRHRTFRFRFIHDPRVATLACSAVHQWLSGYSQQALQTRAEVIAYARELNHASTLAYALFHAGTVTAALSRDAPAVEKFADELVSLSEARDFPLYLAWGRVTGGWATAKSGKQADGMKLFHQGREALMTGKWKYFGALNLALLAELYLEGGDFDEALATLEEAKRLIHRTEERMCAAEIHRLIGEVLLARDPHTPEPADTCFREAVDIARRQGAKSFELRASANRARLWASQGKRDQARDLLAPVFGWFTEGFDTPDLREAKALLDSLS